MWHETAKLRVRTPMRTPFPEREQKSSSMGCKYFDKEALFCLSPCINDSVLFRCNLTNCNINVNSYSGANSYKYDNSIIFSIRKLVVRRTLKAMMLLTPQSKAT